MRLANSQEEADISFMMPKAPAALPPPPAPPTLANAGVQDSAAAARAAAASANGMGFGGTLKTGSQGATAPSTAKQFLGSGE